MIILRILKGLLLLSSIVGIIILFNQFTGNVVFSINQYKIEMPLSYFFVGLSLIKLLFFILYKIWRWVGIFPKWYHDFLTQKRLKKAHHLTLDALCALASKNVTDAQSFSRSAYSFDQNNPYALVLSAYTAYELKDYGQAKQYFETLLKEPRLQFVGYVGLVSLSLSEKDFVTADALLKKALGLQHDSPWVLEKCLSVDLHLCLRDGTRAQEKPYFYKMLTKDQWQEHEKLRSYAQILSRNGPESVDPSKLLSAFPFLPLILTYLAQLGASLSKDSKIAKAMIKKVQETPHPDLLAVLPTLLGYTNPHDAFLYLSKTLDTQNYEVMLFLSRLALKAQLLESSRQLAEQAFKRFPTKRSYALLQELLRTTHADLTILQKKDLVMDAHWHCTSCASMQETYHLFCPSCQGVNTLVYGGVQEAVSPKGEASSHAPSTFPFLKAV